MNWKQEYPTMEMVNQANEETLRAWIDNLPRPVNDGQIIVRIQISRKILGIYARKFCNEEMQKTWNGLDERIEELLPKKTH